MQYGTGSWDCESLGNHRAAVECGLIVDWLALDIDPAAATIAAPAIEGFQPATSFTPTDPIPIDPRRGLLLVVE